jgi:uncharacterized membrane protein YdjX (TVP38/TMEM64 family)
MRSLSLAWLTTRAVLTALFSTCGISLTTFIISAITSLPKPFVNVFLGYALKLQVEGREFSCSTSHTRRFSPVPRLHHCLERN